MQAIIDAEVNKLVKRGCIVPIASQSRLSQSQVKDSTSGKPCALTYIRNLMPSKGHWIEFVYARNAKKRGVKNAFASVAFCKCVFHSPIIMTMDYVDFVLLSLTLPPSLWLLCGYANHKKIF